MSQTSEKFLQRMVLGRIPLLSLLGLIPGIIGGYLYFYYIGCAGGGCAITSNPWSSMIWGALFGYLVFDLVGSYFRKKS